MGAFILGRLERARHNRKNSFRPAALKVLLLIPTHSPSLNNLVFGRPHWSTLTSTGPSLAVFMTPVRAMYERRNVERRGT